MNGPVLELFTSPVVTPLGPVGRGVRVGLMSPALPAGALVFEVDVMGKIEKKYRDNTLCQAVQDRGLLDLEEEPHYSFMVTPGSWLTYLNDFRGINHSWNCEILSTPAPLGGMPTFRVVTTRFVRAGTELVLDYGVDFWVDRQQAEDLAPPAAGDTHGNPIVL